MCSDCEALRTTAKRCHQLNEQLAKRCDFEHLEVLRLRAELDAALLKVNREVLLSPSEVAAMTGMGESTIYEWLATGKLKSKQGLNRYHRIHLADVERLMEQRREKLTGRAAAVASSL